MHTADLSDHPFSAESRAYESGADFRPFAPVPMSAASERELDEANRRATAAFKAELASCLASGMDRSEALEWATDAASDALDAA